MTDSRNFRAESLNFTASPVPADRDHVTGLPNRQQYLRHAAARPPTGETLIMVTLADAGHYSAILRALGHDYADDFVRACVARIQNTIGAEFELFHVSIISIAFIVGTAAETIASNLAKAFHAPIICAGIPILTRIGIGLVTYESQNSAALLRNALAAAQDAREKNTFWSRYDPVSDDANRRALLLISGLSHALTVKDELSLKYQPRIDLHSGQCCGAEALARWRHPGLGDISPAEFIPLIETTALIGPFTEWVLQTAARQHAAWAQTGIAINLAINASPQNLGAAGFTGWVSDIIATHSLPPDKIEIEFTETSLASNENFAKSELAALRAQGLHVALDDFGTGFCNLSYLATMPADILKIDRSFVTNISSNLSAGARARILVRNIIQLAQDLQLRVVAEGIEDDVTLRTLRNWGCDEAQGYLFSRPLAPGQFTEWFTAR